VLSSSHFVSASRIAQELADEVFSSTRLNIHPCTYDAFGMTIVEAASMVSGLLAIVAM
jgi:hypothetical protein